MSSSSLSSVKRLPEVDVLRGLAVGLVLLHHLPFWPEVTGVGTSILRHIAHGGWMGVDLFFVLSGFLVSGLLYKELRRTGSLNVGRFLLRRGLKIWPSYYVLLIGVTVLYAVKSRVLQEDTESVLKLTWFNWISIQNYYDIFWPIGATWSLAIEEHFYLFLPSLFYVLIRIQRRRRQPNSRLLQEIPYLTLIICVATLVARAATFWWGSSTDGNPFFYTHLRLDGLMFGVFLGYLYHFHRTKLDILVKYRSLFLVICLLFIVPSFVFPSRRAAYIFIPGLTLNYLAFGGLLMIAITTPWQRLGSLAICRVLNPPLKFLQVLGVYSYTLYLTNYSFHSRLCLTNRFFADNPPGHL